MTESGLIIDGDAFARDVGRFALLTGRSFGEELKTQAKGVMKNIVKVTPPFHGGLKIADARRAGENAISRDLTRIFRSVPLKGSRRVTHLFGKPHPAAPWIVPEKERHPDVLGIYEQTKRLDRKGRRARYEKPLYVDELKYNALQRRLEKRVGFLGGGFAMAATGLGVPLPAFMKRHAGSAPGQLRMQLEGDELFIIIQNDVRYAANVDDFARRVRYALEMQQGKMERQIPYLLRRHQSLVN